MLSQLREQLHYGVSRRNEIQSMAGTILKSELSRD